MDCMVREMSADEAAIVIDYFHTATPEHLEMLGVDPTRIPARSSWEGSFRQLFDMPVEERPAFLVTWLCDGRVVGFSSCDRIAFGEQAFMHLHVTVPELRQRGIGRQCVARSVDIYFDRLKLRRLFCEPNAFNVGPNRTLQKAGFTYVKTHMTVPGPLNFHQAVTRWLIER